MPIKQTKLVREEAKVTVEFEGDTCEVTYNKRGITPKFLREMQERTKAGEQNVDFTRAALHQLEHLVVEWDVVDDKGRKVACTQDVMDTLPVDFLVVVLTTVWEDCVPNSMRPGTTSGSTSEAGVDAALSPGGTGSFG